MTATLEDMKKAEAVSKASITASAAAWLEALTIARHALSKRPVVPVLGCVLIEATSTRTMLHTNNYEASISVEVVDAVSEPFEALLPIVHLIDTIKAITTDKTSEVTLTLLDFLDRKIALVASESFKYPIVMHHSIEEFPRFTAPTGPAAFSIAAEALRSTIKRTAVASSKDRTLPILTSLHFSSSSADSTLHVEATDRYRVAAVREPAYVRSDVDFILDFELLLKLVPKMRQKQPVSFVVDDTFERDVSVKIIFERFSLSVRCVSGDYPKLAKLWSDEYANNFTVSRSALMHSALVAQRLSLRNTPCTFELLGDRLRLRPNRDGLDSVSAGMLEVPSIALAPRTSDRIDFAVNPVYLLDALKLIEGDVVTISFNSVVKPFVFSASGTSADEPFRYLLMPVRYPS